MLTDQQLERLSRDWRRVPLPALASQLGTDLLSLLADMRKVGIVTEVQPQELQFIQANLGRLPREEIRDRLRMSRTQFSQICEKLLGQTPGLGSAPMNLDQAVAKTRWLIEEKLQIPLDDFLPRTITNEHFIKNRLYQCTHFAEREKARDALYRFFPAVAFLVCQAYPSVFRPFQFRHAKQNVYFKGKEGRRSILNAVRWIIERKLLIAPENVPTLIGTKYFLRSADLQFYGVGSHWYRQHFTSKDELLSAVLKLYDPNAGVVVGGSSARLRQTLAQAGRPLRQCEVVGCYYDDEFGLDVHHIIPRASATTHSLPLHGADNLVAVCPNHHRLARRFRWAELNVESPGEWRAQILEFLASLHPTAEEA